MGFERLGRQQSLLLLSSRVCFFGNAIRVASLRAKIKFSKRVAYQYFVFLLALLTRAQNLENI